jgi:hypothetical protein
MSHPFSRSCAAASGDTARAHAKARALRRATSSGGTMFVVAMTLAVLSTIGAWALQSAALEVRMAGYERQSTQTHYLAEYGVIAAMQDLAPAVAGNVITNAMCGAPTSGGGVTHAACTSVPCLNFTTTPVSSTCTEISVVQPVAHTCFRWEAASMPGGFSPSTTAALMDSPDGGVTGTPGSLGATTTTGTFSVEVTEVGNAPPASGFSPNASAAFYWATVTSYGRTSTSGSNSSEGDEQLRARLEIGPIPPVNKGSCQ